MEQYIHQDSNNENNTGEHAQHAADIPGNQHPGSLVSWVLPLTLIIVLISLLSWYMVEHAG